MNKNKKKRTYQIVDFAVLADNSVKLKESKNRDKYLDLKKTMEHEVDGDTNWRARFSYQNFGTGTEGLGNKRTSIEHPNYSIVEVSPNVAKSPGDLGRLAITQTPGRNHQLTLVWKTLMIIIIIWHSNVKLKHEKAKLKTCNLNINTEYSHSLSLLF